MQVVCGNPSLTKVTGNTTNATAKSYEQRYVESFATRTDMPVPDSARYYQKQGMGSVVGAGAQPWRGGGASGAAGGSRGGYGGQAQGGYGKREESFKDLTAPIPKAMAQAKSEAGFKVGQSVFHNKFGEGVILTLEGNGADARVQVNFGRHGTKWLMLSVAKLTPIE